jgi:bifunctional DNA-binding transcriptional regulator/antitoxin component of YhaV-PrlF toxin-antitoxin module
MHVVTISSKNQITIPAKVLLEVGLGKSEKAIIKSQGGVITIVPAGASVTDQVAGSLKEQIPQNKIGSSLKKIDSVVKKRVSERLVTK